MFMRFIARATKICYEKFLRVEIEYLTGIFCENGHDNFEKKHVVPTIIIKTIKLTKTNNYLFLDTKNRTKQKKCKSLDL